MFAVLRSPFSSVGLLRAGIAGLVVAGCFPLACVKPAAAADRPSLQCLPDDTLFTARLPNVASFVAALQTRTKLGQVFTSEKRLDDLKELLRSESQDDWDALSKGLERLGLAPEDLWQAARGEIGYAGFLRRTAEPEPVYLGLGWIHCDDALAQKWLAALERTLGDQPEAEPTLRREDVDLAGNTVMHLTISTWQPKPGVAAPAGPVLPTVKKGPATTEKSNDDDAPAPEKKPEPQIETNQSHLFVERRADRIVFGHVSLALLGPDNAAVKPSQVERVEALKTAFAKFVEAHRSGVDGDAIRNWQETPGLAEALPDGEPLVDLLVNVRGLTALADTPTNAENWKFIQAAGADKVGPLAYRIALEEGVLRSGLFLGVPAPRTGLLTLLDQTPLKSEPADWVSNAPVGYQHISFDLGKAYQTIARLVRSDLPRGQGMLTTLETQCKAFLQTDPATLLTGLGKTHTMLTYLPKLVNDPDPRRANREDATTQNAMAIIWSGPDEQLYKRLMNLLSTATAQPVVAEQGFSGMRYEQDKLSAGWFIGNGYMVLAMGQGITEKVLANLRSTPRSSETMRATAFAKRAAELLPPTGVLTYDLTDGAGLVRFTDSVMQRAFADISDDDAAKLKKLWPTADEWQGTIGVSVSATSLDAKGLTYRSALDLPSP
jgi:hypothetical protein